MKKTFVCFLLMLFMSISRVYAAEYGDLYNIKWCPCNPDEQFNSKGSVVLGRTVMCPCDAMYDGYGRTFEKDVRKVQDKAEHAVDKMKQYRYYVGFEYNKSQVETSRNKISFNDVIFHDVNGIKTDSGEMIDHQDNIGVILGFRPHKNFGFEAFYNRSYNKNEVTQYDAVSVGVPGYHMINSYTSEYQAFGIDLIGYMPITQYFDIVAMAGLGKYKFKNKATFEARNLEGAAEYSVSYDFSENKMAYRVGGGVQFNIASGVVLRLMYKYINVNSDTIKYLQEYSVSLRFLF